MCEPSETASMFQVEGDMEDLVHTTASSGSVHRTAMSAPVGCKSSVSETVFGRKSSKRGEGFLPWFSSGPKVMEVKIEPELRLHNLAASSQPHAPADIEFVLAQGDDVNRADSVGRTPLHIAARQGNLKVIWVLLSNGADLTRKNDDEQTPEEVAAAYNQIQAQSLFQLWLQRSSANPTVEQHQQEHENARHRNLNTQGQGTKQGEHRNRRKNDVARRQVQEYEEDVQRIRR